MRQKQLWNRGTRVGIAVSISLAQLVLVHDLVGTVPWLIALIAAAGAALLALLSAETLVLGIAGSASLTILGIEQLRRLGGTKAEKSRASLEQQLELERDRVDRHAAALKCIGELSLRPLEGLELNALDERTGNWVNDDLVPVVEELVPDVGLGILRLDDRGYALACDIAMPEIVRRVFPNQTDMRLTEFLEPLKLENSLQIPLSTMTTGNKAEWLLVFSDSPLDEPAKALFAVAARMISDARAAALIA